MKKNWYLPLVLLAVIIFTQSACAEDAFTEIKLPKGSENAVKVTLDQGVKLEADLYEDTFFDGPIINANAKVTNTTAKPMYFAYYIAFFDTSKKFIGCTSYAYSSSPMEPGESTSLGSCLITVPKSDLEKVAYYQLRFYVSPEPVNK